MYKTKSLSSNLDYLEKSIIKIKSFDNFNDLILKGQVKYMEYDDYVNQNKDTTKKGRQNALKNYFYNNKHTIFIGQL